MKQNKLAIDHVVPRLNNRELVFRQLKRVLSDEDIQHSLVPR
jgi:hypothetical protein